jgi:hypothetical protein
MNEDEDNQSLSDILIAEFIEGAKVSKDRQVDKKLLAAHKCSSHHRLQIESSKLCGCFYCLSTFPAAEIEEWMHDIDAATCPICRTDSVLGDASGFPLTKGFLSEMRLEWFGFLPARELKID